MSNLVTYTQAQRLKKFGFDRWSQFSYYKNDVTFQKTPKKFTSDYSVAPTVSEALDFIREEKGIACGVHPYAIYEDMTDGDQHFVKWGYKYVAFQGLSEWQNMNKDVFDTHPLAESALLDAVLTYLEKK